MIDVDNLRDFYKEYSFFNARTNSYVFDSPTKEQYLRIRDYYCDRFGIDKNRFGVCFALSATELIFNILKEYQNFRVIFVGECHENVRRLARTLQFSSEPIFTSVDDLQSLDINDPRVFVYFTSTEYQTGKINDNKIVKNFIDNLREKGVAVRSLNDAVQQLMILKKVDYSFYDFVIYTGHSLLINFDLGVCFFNNDFNQNYGFNWYSIPMDYLYNLSLVEPEFSADNLDMFQKTMRESFSDWIESGHLVVEKDVAPHIFAGEVRGFNEKLLNKLCNKNRFLLRFPNKYVLKIRYQELLNIEFPEELFDDLRKLEVLEND